MNKSKDVIKIIIGSIVILLVAQTLNAVLGISSFEKNYRQSLIGKYELVAKEFKRKIEVDLNNEIPINLFRTNKVNLLFKDVFEKESGIDTLFITNKKGEVLYSNQKQYINNAIPLPDSEIPTFKNLSDEETQINSLTNKAITKKQKNYYYIAVPLYYWNKRWDGTAYIRFDENEITKKTAEITKDNFKYILITFSSAITFLIILILIIDKYTKDDGKIFGKFNSKQVKFAVVIFTLLVSQSIYAYMNNDYFQKTYMKEINKNIVSLRTIIKDNIENLLNRVRRVEQLKGTEKLLSEIVENIAECKKVEIANSDKQLVYFASNEDAGSIFDENFESTKIGIEETKTTKVIPLYKNKQIASYAIIHINQKLIDERTQNLLFDSLTVVIASIIFSYQLFLFLALLISRGDKLKNIYKKYIHSRQKVSEHMLEDIKNMTEEKNKNIVKLTAFILFFAELMIISFLPMYIKSLYEAHPLSLWGLSKDAILSLPIASYMLGSSITVPLAGFLSEKLSVKKIFVISSGLLIIGTGLSAFAVDISQLMIFRFISGLGYGAAIMNGTNLIVKIIRSKNRAAGFGYWFGGYAAAGLCAIPIGGIIVARLGFAVGMLTSAGAGIILLLFTFLFVEKEKRPQKRNKEEDKVLKKTKWTDLLTAFKNPKLFATLIFVVVPTQIVYIGFFQYAFPLYLSSINFSQANIARLMGVYSLITLLTPWAGKMSDKYNKDRLFIVIGGFIVGIVLALFLFVPGGFWMSFFAIVAMAIGSKIVESISESYVSHQKEAKEIGETKLLSIFTTIGKVSSVIGPILVGFSLALLGHVKSMFAMGIIILIGTLLFAVLSRKAK